MKLKRLKELVDAAMLIEGNSDLDVGIPNNKPSFGGTKTTKVKNAGQGFDWNFRKFLIWPENEMIEKEEY